MPYTPVEDLAMRWVPGEGPVEIQPLTAGLVNESWRVTRAGANYRLRAAAAHSPDLGLDRRWECAVLERAAAAGLTSAVRRCEPDSGLLVADWASGHSWDAAEIGSPANVHAMALLLRRVHALEIPRPARCMNPRAWISHYPAALARRGGAPSPGTAELRILAEDCLANLAQQPARAPVLCHSDLHRLNVLVGADIVLLDWEYAHVSDPFWDLAGWISNNDWSEGEAGVLLASYLQRSPEGVELACLSTWAWLYDYVCVLWSELYQHLHPGAQGRAVAARAEYLTCRLIRAAPRAYRWSCRTSSGTLATPSIGEFNGADDGSGS